MQNMNMEENIVTIDCNSIKNQSGLNKTKYLYLKCSIASIVITIITFMLFVQFLAFIITLPYLIYYKKAGMAITPTVLITGTTRETYSTITTNTSFLSPVKRLATLNSSSLNVSKNIEIETNCPPNLYENQSLINATKKNDIDFLNSAIESGYNLNTKDKIGRTPLIWASIYGYAKIVRLLIKSCANTDIQDYSESSLINIDHSSIQEKSGLGLQTISGNTAIIHASYNGYFEVVKALSEGSSNLDLQNNYGETALIYACFCGFPNILHELIVAKANLNTQNKDGNTGLHWTTFNNNYNMTKTLVQAKANLNIQNNAGETPLIYAIMKRFNQIGKLLITKNADLNIKNKNDDTVLLLATYNNDIEIVNILIEAKVDLNSQNRFGDTALNYASKRGFLKIVTALLKAKADFSKTRYFRVTPMINYTNEGTSDTLTDSDSSE